MFILRAPYPTIQVTTLLPSPTWSDSKALAATVSTKRAMNGTLYTNVNTRAGRKSWHWAFQLSRHKALELREFINSYYGRCIQVQTHLDDTLVGYLRNNPFEFSGTGRANGWPGQETMSIEIDFEEK